MTTEAKAPKVRTVTLTGKPPVRVREDLWPVIASARRHDGQVECQANHLWHLTVRQHADGRTLVYGSEDRGNGGVYRGYEAAYAGEMLEPGSDIASAIIRVGEDARCSKAMQDECVADLPAVDLDGETSARGHVTMPLDGAKRLLALLDRVNVCLQKDPSAWTVDGSDREDMRAAAEELRKAIAAK